MANNGRGMSNLPYYCDIDEDGNFGELKFLPCPEKDFFGNTPQYVSATWISEDGHTIAGQVIENRGFFVYPIVFTENEQGIWSYSLPSESLFNMDHLEVPKPLGDFDEEYPDLKSTEITDYMDPSKLADWNAAMLQWEINNFADAYDPYNNLEKFMTEEQIEEYIEAVNAYNEAVEIYNQDNFEYWEKVFAIVDCSAFFVRNGMALSPDGRWLASSAEWEDTSSTLYDEPMMYYVPYQFNLTTGEIKKVDSNTSNVNTVQVFNNGDVISVSPAALAMPPRSWIYLNDRGESLNIADYVKEVSPFYGAWYEENLTGPIPVAEDENGNLVYEHATVTGHVAMSEDQSVLVGGVQGYSIGLEMYLSYIFNDMNMAGVEKIADETNFDGTYHVYNLQGVKVLTTKDTSLLKSLPHGIYVINGKKIIK
ncbi:MAG: hypothetical protein J1F67_11170 [Muribaculaceae bacterium]|nr:hypothetical protein [Muribaculaceae bacterium]